MVKTQHRIVSLTPSVTEIIAASGFDSALVGCSHACDYPPLVGRLTRVTSMQYDPNQPSARIHAQIEALEQAGKSLVKVSTHTLNQLYPTIVITDSVSSLTVTVTDVRRALIAVTDHPAPRVLGVAPQDLASVFETARTIATALDAPSHGEVLIATMRGRMEAIHARAVAEVRNKRVPRVLCLDWIEPVRAAGYWIPELVAKAGATPLISEVGAAPMRISFADIVAADPDIILIMPQGMTDYRARSEMTALTRHPEWKTLRAVKNETIYLADGHQYFNRPGPRLVESLEILAEIIHPEAFSFGHMYNGWQRFSLRELFR